LQKGGEAAGPVHARLGQGAVKALLLLVAALPSSEIVASKQGQSVAKKIGEAVRMSVAPTPSFAQDLARVFIASHGGAHAAGSSSPDSSVLTLGPIKALSSAVHAKIGPTDSFTLESGNQVLDDDDVGPLLSPPTTAAGARGQGGTAARGGSGSAGSRTSSEGIGSGSNSRAVVVVGLVEDPSSSCGVGDGKAAGGGRGGGGGGNKNKRLVGPMTCVVAEVVCEALEATLKDVDYVLSLLKKLPKAYATTTAATKGDQQAAAAEEEAGGGSSPVGGDDESGGGGGGAPSSSSSSSAAKQVVSHTEAVSARLLAVAKGCGPLVRCQLMTSAATATATAAGGGGAAAAQQAGVAAGGRTAERLLGVLKQFYDALVKLAKLWIEHKVRDLLFFFSSIVLPSNKQTKRSKLTSQ
jgi:hypothetical protein